MTDHSALPDEIVSEILSPALKVSDDIFSDTSEVSPFSEYSESSSAYLLVCKSWLRVATPFLYNVVILRSTAQAKALAQSLSTNEELGRFIQQLRVEGAYGPSMGTILGLSPNISDLFISFEIWAEDNTGGLCRGLSLINPRRVILRDSKHKLFENRMALNLEDALKDAIATWDRLTIIEMPVTNGERWRGANRVSTIVQGLTKSSSLRTVTIPSGVDLCWVYLALKDCPLQIIQIKEAVHPAHLESWALDDHPTLKARLRFTEKMPAAKDDFKRGVVSQHRLINPFLIPMKAASEATQDTIWTRILYFAMSVPELAQNPGQTDLPPRLPLLLVSKTLNRLGLPHLYAHVQLKGSTATSKFSSALLHHPSLAALVRTIWGDIDSTNVYVWDSEDDPDAAEKPSQDGSVLAILSQTTGLVQLCGWASKGPDYSPLEPPISWDAFELLAKSSGATLQHLSKRISAHHTASTAIFANLTALKSLNWNCYSCFECPSEEEDTPSDGLSNLTDLEILAAHASFLTALSIMKLPSLRRLLLNGSHIEPEHFLSLHGTKLTELHTSFWIMKQLKLDLLAVCPGLNFISFFANTEFTDPPDAKHFSPSEAALRLEKIVIDMRYWSGQVSAEQITSSTD
ncbi:hypothetical protein DFH09DRAFT_1299344 [Mycena vulgaris]|nr:hypothetical protein DFH09DRAFT_1299344 [Mycena vulgaris]